MQTNPLDSPYGRGQFRWRFADQFSERELELKKETLKKIETFWSEFQRQSEQIVREFRSTRGRSIVNFIEKYLTTIDRGIMWECGPHESGGFLLEFTAESNKHVRPLVVSLLEAAPNIQGWKFCESRMPLPLETVESGFEGKLNGKQLFPFTVELQATSANGIDLLFVAPNFDGNNSQADLGAMFLLTEMVLGEAELDNWVEGIQTKKGSLAHSMTSVQAAEKFRSSFAAKKKEVIHGISEQPYHQHPFVDQAGFFQLSETPESVSRFTMTCHYKEFIEVLFNGRFNSERLSRCGERFCYLQFAGDPSYLEVDKREALEDAIEKILRHNKVGVKVGAGIGLPSTTFVDICLHDIDKAIPLLRQISEEFRLPKNAKLRFYDSDWKHEWVGMFPETTAPNDSSGLWKP